MNGVIRLPLVAEDEDAPRPAVLNLSMARDCSQRVVKTESTQAGSSDTRPFLHGAQLGLVLSLFCTTALCAAAYQPPTGIPAPPFGIDETVATVYGTADYYTYWIDNTHPNSTDTNNPKGTPALPRKTIPSTLTLVAGDVVQIRGGPYASLSDRFAVFASGRADAPVFITGSTVMPELTKFLHVKQAQYLIVEGFRSMASFSIRPMTEGDANRCIAIRYCEIAGTGALGVGGYFGVTSSYAKAVASDIVFYANVSRDIGDWRSSTENDRHAFFVGSNSTNVWILENTAYHASGDGIQCSHGASFTSHHIYIGKNHFYECRENAVDLKEANDVVVSENTMHGFRPTSSSAGEAIVVHYDPTNIWILNNLILDCENGIVGSGSSRLGILGNVIRDVCHTGTTWSPTSSYANGAAIRVYSSMGVYIAQNTLYNCDFGIQFPNPTAGDTYVACGNLIAGRGEPAGAEIVIGSGLQYVSSDFNLVSAPDGGRWRLSAVDRTLAYLQSTLGRELNTLEADPQFLDTQTLQLQPGSPAVDRSTLSDAYGQFLELYGVAITMDRDGVLRPQGALWDIGAYEVVKAMTAPMRLRVITPDSID